MTYLSPAAQTLLKPEMTPVQQADALMIQNLSADAVKVLADGMRDRQSTWYACQSTQRVSDHLGSADKQALEAAIDWAKDPTPENQELAAAAAAKTNHQGPGAWSAQAAAWSRDSTYVASPAKVPENSAVSAFYAPSETGIDEPTAISKATEGLTSHAASGAVLLAAAIEAKAAMPPMTDAAKIHQPYIDLGKAIASGKNTWS